MEFAILPLLEIAELNTRLYLNCLEGLGDASVLQRPNSETNNIAFIACHILDNRYFLTQDVGLTLEHPLANHTIFSDPSIRSVDDVKDYPALEHVRNAWKNLSVTLLDHLPAMTEEALQQTTDNPYPVEDKSTLAGIAFLLQHESYHIGQLSLLRKYLGLKAMSYK
jgi:uncharacterized damage-inducible protein DinB